MTTWHAITEDFFLRIAMTITMTSQVISITVPMAMEMDGGIEVVRMDLLTS